MQENTSVNLALRSWLFGFRWQVKKGLFWGIKVLCSTLGPSSTLPVIHISTEAQSAFFKKEAVQKDVKAVVSQKAALSCDVADSKTEVKWYKDGKLLTSTKTLHAESKGKNRQLVIDSVEKKDAGEYSCEVGIEKLLFKLHVTGRE